MCLVATCGLRPMLGEGGLPKQNTVASPACKVQNILWCRAKEGDELTFLRGKQVMIGRNQLAIQSHPKRNCLNFWRSNVAWCQRRHPVMHSLMNRTTPKSWTPNMRRYIDLVFGNLLYISRDYIECQYTIRALSRSMSRPTENSFACLRHLCIYVSVGMYPKLSSSQIQRSPWTSSLHPWGLYLEAFSDSDWAKHRSSRKSVSPGVMFLFGNLLYSS